MKITKLLTLLTVVGLLHSCTPDPDNRSKMIVTGVAYTEATSSVKYGKYHYTITITHSSNNMDWYSDSLYEEGQQLCIQPKK